MPGAANDCIFCAIVAGEAPAEILDSDEQTVTFMDINPATRGHALVIPQRAHRGSARDLRRGPAGDRASRRGGSPSGWRSSLKPDGFNLINACRAAAWQTVFHFHIHVIPRYEDDPLKLPWIPRGADMDEIATIAATIRDGGN